jgi:hypothetical protein
MRISVLLTTLLLTLSSALFSQSGRIALVIGNSDYEHAAGLRNPVNDAKDVSAQLKLLGFKVIERYDVEMRDMKRTIDAFGEELGDHEVGLFYFSGHGIQVHGYNYLIPVDANLQSESDAEYECINAGRVLSKMEGSGVKTSIIILDACRNNPFENSWERGLTSSGLAFMEAPTGSLIAYSTAPGKTASDGSGRNGLYTKNLLKQMGDPEYNIIQVFQEVRKNVREESGGQQVPWESTSLEDDFFFNQTGYRIDLFQDQLAKNESKDASRKVSKTFEEIKEDPSMLWSEDEGKDVEEADLNARNGITVKIMQVLFDRTGIGNMTKEKQAGIGYIAKELLLQTERRVAAERRTSYSLRFIPGYLIDRYLEREYGKVKEYFEAADRAMENLKIADASRNYFWVYALCAVTPGETGLKTEDGQGDILTHAATALQDLADHTLAEIVDSSSFGDRKVYTLEFSYRGRKVENIDFTYWNGEQWSAVVCANNGSAVVSMHPGSGMQDLKISMEYSDDSETKFDPYLQLAVKAVDPDADSEISVRVTSGSYKKHHEISGEHLAVIDAVLEKVKEKENDFDPDLFTREGYEVYKQLLIYGNAQFLSIGNSYTSFELYGNTYIRSVPFTFSFRNNRVNFSEDLCFELDPEGRVNNISFALSSSAIDDIMKMTRWPLESKLQIIHFLENYKTAYALKRDEYIEKIFSDNALIIVGKKLEVAKQSDQGKYRLTGDNYEFTRLTKEEYLYRLRRVFKWNEYINIQFEENVVKKRDNESEVYGINIKQNYFSSSYADQGYLFLMVDLKDPGQPAIYVRSWQPEKFADGRVINLSDFSY